MTPKTRILVLNNPYVSHGHHLPFEYANFKSHNPLGKVFSVDELFSIGKICVKHGVIILSDEVYERLHYTNIFHRIATLSPEIARHTVTVGSIGKAFNATGWRIGYAIGDRDLIKHVQNAHIILSYSTAGPSQIAAAVGLEKAEEEGYWEKNRQDMKSKIDCLCEVFRELELPVSTDRTACSRDANPRETESDSFFSTWSLQAHITFLLMPVGSRFQRGTSFPQVLLVNRGTGHSAGS